MAGDLSLIDISQHHTTAVVGLLVAAGYTTYPVEVTDDVRTFPYLVIYPSPGSTAVNDLGHHAREHTYQWQVTAVGLDWMETTAAIDRARWALVDERPTVAGRTCAPITEISVNVPVRQDPTERDPSTGRPLFYSVAQFTVLSVAA